MDAPENNQPYVITNKAKINGAVVFPMIVDDLKARFGSFYMIPSSVHEVIIYPETVAEGNLEMFSEWVRTVNETELDPKDVLSNHAYYYGVA